MYPKFLLTLIGLWTATLIADEFPFEPPKNFTLSPQYIALHHPVKTNNITAQLYFDQGLTFLYAFNHDAAYWSFLKASEADPNMAMAYWGMAYAMGSNINMDITSNRAKIAYDTSQKALRLAANGPDNERAYAEALAKRYSADPKADPHTLAKDYSQAMAELYRKYPDDLDAAVLYAESLLDVRPWDQWSLDGKPLEGTTQAIATLQSVLLQDPMHLGANHFYVHTLEASAYPASALLSADRLKTLLPSSGHILHMPSHIYLLVGDYEQAAQTNEKAVAADREYIRLYGVGGIYPIHYLTHNLHFLAQAYSMQGNYSDAKRAAEELSKLYLPHFKRMPELEEYASTLLFTELRFHKWTEILALPKPPDDMHITQTLWHFARSIALANLGNMTQAQEEQKLFLKGKEHIAEASKYGYNNAQQILALAQNYLEAKLAQAQGQIPTAIDYFNRAIVEQDKLHYDEPPNWLFSVRESLGGQLLKEKKFGAAEQVFREDLKRHPRSGRSLYGLKESLLGQSKTTDYYWINQAFEKAWMYSDIDLNPDAL